MIPRFSHLFSIFTDPERNGCPPVPVTRYRPITCLSQPVSKSLLFHKIRHPAEKKALKDTYLKKNVILFTEQGTPSIIVCFHFSGIVKL